LAGQHLVNGVPRKIRSPALKTIHAQLLALILAVALPLAGVLGFIWHKAVQESSAAATEYLRQATASVVVDLRRVHRQSDWMLAQLAIEPAVRELRASACEETLKPLRRLHPEFINLIIWNSAGEIVCSALPVPPDSDRVGWTKAPFERAMKSKGLEVSDAFRGHITRAYIVLFTYPITDASGTAIGALSATVSLKHLDEMLQHLDLPAGSAVAVIDRNFDLIARVPDGDKWRGTSVKRQATDEVPDAADRAAGLVRGIDGIERLYVSLGFPEAGWRVFAGIPRDHLLSRHRRWLLWAVAIALFMMAFGSVVAYAIAARLSREFKRMLGGEHELMGRLLRAEEQERTRISRELHDQIGQELTALTLDLKSLQRRGAPEVLARAVGTVIRLIDQVADVTLALRPPQLDDLGLVAALRGHVERHVRTHGIKVHMDADLDPGRLSRDLEVTCFRIVQETLTNVLRHADAGNVWIRLKAHEHDLELAVRDDGEGFDVEAGLKAAADSRSLGLRNLLDRAQLVGGALQIWSHPGGGGTEVRARFPL
jgi:signal transduction histidine kinase